MSNYEGHTRGPWRARNGHITGPLDVVLAHTALGLIMVGGKDEYRISQSEEEANARLIADAPALLAERNRLLVVLKSASKALHYELSYLEHDAIMRAVDAALTEGGKG